mmetsp:Transcript_2453/g.6091  ORF Transcript_2453/g.6091 Transcript_2453/m.6091 type:complete len:160 (-) Transcript_2453:365-844(-)
MMTDISNMLKNMVDDSTLIVTTGPPRGGSNFCSLNWTSVQRIPPQIAAVKTSTKPTVSNSTSPNAVKISPAVINSPTIIRLQVTFSSPNMNALSNTHIGADDLTMVKNVMEIRTKERFDNPTSNAVTSPHGIETPKYVFHDISVTTAPPKNSGNKEEAL